jgi:hypothetical protein
MRSESFDIQDQEKLEEVKMAEYRTQEEPAIKIVREATKESSQDSGEN